MVTRRTAWENLVKGLRSWSGFRLSMSQTYFLLARSVRRAPCSNSLQLWKARSTSRSFSKQALDSGETFVFEWLHPPLKTPPKKTRDERLQTTTTPNDGGDDDNGDDSDRRRTTNDDGRRQTTAMTVTTTATTATTTTDDDERRRATTDDDGRRRATTDDKRRQQQRRQRSTTNDKRRRTPTNNGDDDDDGDDAVAKNESKIQAGKHCTTEVVLWLRPGCKSFSDGFHRTVKL